MMNLVLKNAAIQPSTFKRASRSHWCSRRSFGGAGLNIRHNLTAVPQSVDDIDPVPALEFPPLSQDELIAQANWLSDMLRLWLDEEWIQQDIHARLGTAAGQAYFKLRQQGQNEAGDVILGIASELLTFDLKEAFVGPFDIANKSVELLMLKAECGVCCTGEAEQNAIQRYEEQLKKENSKRMD